MTENPGQFVDVATGLEPACAERLTQDVWRQGRSLARAADPRSGDLRHLREQGLIETVRVPGYRDHTVVLTKEGRNVLEHRRDPDHERHQTFHAGLVRPRELEHDVQIYRAYEQAEAGLLERGARIDRVELDHERKGRVSALAARAR